MSTFTQPAPPHAPYRTPRGVRRALAAAAGALALFLVGLGAFHLLDLASRHTTVERTSHAGVRALVVQGSADINLTSTPEGGRLEVVTRRTEGLRRPEYGIAEEPGGTLRLAGSCSQLFTGQCGVRYDVRVPAGTDVRAHTDAGDITASDLSAPVLDLSSSGGDIDADGVRAGRVRARSSAGDVNVALSVPADRLDAGSSAGDVALRVPNAIYRLETDADAGDVSSADVRTDPASPRLISARTSAGDVQIDVVR